MVGVANLTASCTGFDRTMPSSLRIFAGFLVLFADLCVLCANATTSVAADTWPRGEWEQIEPAKAGWSVEALEVARSYSLRLGTAAFIAVQNGRIVTSWGNIDAKREVASVRKSLLNALIGMAVAEDKIRLDATLAALGVDDVPPPLTETEKQATVRQLLQARSGVYHAALYETRGMAERRPVRGSHLPGTFWYYNNWDFNVLGAIYERAVGASIFDSFERRIARPLGMQDFHPNDGRYVDGAASRYPAYPFHMTARDLARFGLLYARAGRWRDATVVPAAWVKESTTAWSETDRHSGYGYLWWVALANKPDAIMHLSNGGFWAHGNKGQFIVIDAKRDLVVVHQTEGDTSVGEGGMSALMQLVLKAAHADN